MYYLGPGASRETNPLQLRWTRKVGLERRFVVVQAVNLHSRVMKDVKLLVVAQPKSVRDPLKGIIQNPV